MFMTFVWCQLKDKWVIYEQQHCQESTRVELRSPASMTAHSEMHTDPVVPKLLCISSVWVFQPSKSLYESKPQIPPLKQVAAPFLPNVEKIKALLYYAGESLPLLEDLLNILST